MQGLMKGSYAKQELQPPAHLFLPPHPSFPFSLYLFILEVFWSFPPLLVGSIISLGPRPPLSACSATVGSLCSWPLCWNPIMLLCACMCVFVLVCAVFLQPPFNHRQPSLHLLSGWASVNQVSLEMQSQLNYTGTTEDRDTAFSWLLKTCVWSRRWHTLTHTHANAKAILNKWALFFISQKLPDTHHPSSLHSLSIFILFSNAI